MLNHQNEDGALQNALHFEARSAADYHELRIRHSVHSRPWYEHATRAAKRNYFQNKAHRMTLQGVLELPQMEESIVRWVASEEPPLPANWPNEPSEKLNQWAAEEKYLPWRHLVYEYNNSEERASCAPLTCRAFYECCQADLAFQVRWTPYSDLNNTPFGPISGDDLDEAASPPFH